MDLELLKPLIGNIPNVELTEEVFEMRFSMVVRERLLKELVEKLGCDLFKDDGFAKERREICSEVKLNSDFRSSKEGVERCLEIFSEVVDVIVDTIKSEDGDDNIVVGPMDVQILDDVMKICLYFGSNDAKRKYFRINMGCDEVPTMTTISKIGSGSENKVVTCKTKNLNVVYGDTFEF
jgi:hypothetical protein